MLDKRTRLVVAALVGALLAGTGAYLAGHGTTGDSRDRMTVARTSSTTATSPSTTTLGTTPPSTTTSTSSPTPPVAAETTIGVTVGASPPVATVPTVDPALPQPGDFAGTLRLLKFLPPIEDAPVPVPDATFVVLDQPDIALRIHNITDHVVYPSLGVLPQGVAIVCTHDLSAEGRTNEPLVMHHNFEFVTALELDPSVGSGAEAVADFTPVLSDADVGVTTCAGVILSSADGSWSDSSIHIVARLTNIPAVSFTVVPLPAAPGCADTLQTCPGTITTTTRT